jgi:hypothetical protein
MNFSSHYSDQVQKACVAFSRYYKLQQVKRYQTFPALYFSNWDIHGNVPVYYSTFPRRAGAMGDSVEAMITKLHLRAGVEGVEAYDDGCLVHDSTVMRWQALRRVSSGDWNSVWQTGDCRFQINFSGSQAVTPVKSFFTANRVHAPLDCGRRWTAAPRVSDARSQMETDCQRMGDTGRKSSWRIAGTRFCGGDWMIVQETRASLCPILSRARRNLPIPEISAGTQWSE